MTIVFKKERADRFVRECIVWPREAADAGWIEKINMLSVLSEESGVRTHIAFLGVSLLAKALNPDVDLYAIKPTHADGNPNAYSARSLAHGTLVPLAAELGFHLGVTGREPLNNQPYFRMKSFNDGVPVSGAGSGPYLCTVQLIAELSGIHDSNLLAAAFKAFLTVRQEYQPKYVDANLPRIETIPTLAKHLTHWVCQDSENGKRAQAAAAGIMDIALSANRIEAGRINDPSRHYPGDVCIKSVADGRILRTFEVRDKAVSINDIFLFGQRCLASGVLDAGVVAVSPDQVQIDEGQIFIWGDQYGIHLRLYTSWFEFVSEALFWGPNSTSAAVEQVLGRVRARAIEVEVSEDGVARLQERADVGQE